MPIRILLVDDHEMFRAGLRAMLAGQADFEVVGEAENGRAATEMVTALSPDVIIMDLQMRELNGIDAARQALALRPGVKVIGLSARSDKAPVLEMLRAGASGYVLKQSAYEELVSAIRTVMNDKVYLNPSMTSMMAEDYVSAGARGATSAFRVLSSREREVLQLLSEGKATKEVAMALHVSVKTAETHRRNLMEKLQVDSVAELTKYAIREGITEL